MEPDPRRPGPALEGWELPGDGGRGSGPGGSPPRWVPPGSPAPQLASPGAQGSKGQELLLLCVANPDDVCGPEPPRPHEPPAAALYEVVCDLGAPLHVQLDARLRPAPLPGSSVANELPAPALRLTEEEKRLLAQEGVTLPGALPLTQAEERILKKVRRKIRNKQSAQDSRRRKKEYLAGLESRAAACSAQNQELRERIQELEKRNGSLLRELQALIKRTSNKAAQTGACALILLLSLGLILFPSYSPFGGGAGGSRDGARPTGVISRSILAQGEPLGWAGEAPFPAPGWLRGEEPGAAAADGAGGWLGDGSPPAGREPGTSSSGRGPPGGAGAAKRGHGDEM